MSSWVIFENSLENICKLAFGYEVCTRSVEIERHKKNLIIVEQGPFMSIYVEIKIVPHDPSLFVRSCFDWMRYPIYWTFYVGSELEDISHEQTPLLLRPIPRLAGEYMKD